MLYAYLRLRVNRNGMTKGGNQRTFYQSDTEFKTRSLPFFCSYNANVYIAEAQLNAEMFANFQGTAV